MNQTHSLRMFFKCMISIFDQHLDHGDFVYICMKLKEWRILKSCSHVWHENNAFIFILVWLSVTNAFDTWLAMYVERVADDEMCFYCRGVNNYISFLFFLYFCHYFTNVVLIESLELFLHDNIWKTEKHLFVSENIDNIPLKWKHLL